jgi:hypothetical protein
MLGLDPSSGFLLVDETHFPDPLKKMVAAMQVLLDVSRN